MNILNEYIPNLGYSLYTFLICWYPCFIIVSSFRVLYAALFCDKKYSKLNTIYSVLFTTYFGTKYNSFTTKYDRYSFIIKGNHLKKYYEQEDMYSKRFMKTFIIVLYLCLILVLGAVGAIKNDYNSVYIYRALFYVNLIYFVGLTSLFIWEIPMELYAKQLVIKYINSNEQ